MVEKKLQYLGVIIDEKLNRKEHLEMVRSKVVKDACAIARLRNYINKKTLMSVYYSMIFSHLNYCVINWGNATESSLKSLLLLQKRAVRLITNSDFHAHANLLFKDL